MFWLILTKFESLEKSGSLGNCFSQGMPVHGMPVQGGAVQGATNETKNDKRRLRASEILATQNRTIFFDVLFRKMFEFFDNFSFALFFRNIFEK